VKQLEMVGLRFAYGAARAVVDGIDASADGPGLIAIVGPNGAGKSTLLDLIAGQKVPASGSCRLNGHEAHLMPRAALCRLVAHVPQLVPGEIPFTVEEVVLTGRIPYGRGLFENDEDRAAMDSALRRTRLEGFRERRFSALSGGEKQRVLLAAALCQEAPMVLLDEPSAHLDPENEAEMWELLKELKAAGKLVIVVTHHLGLAAQHCDRVWLLEKGKLAADGVPCDALEAGRLERVFRVPFYWHQNAEGRVFLTYGR